MDFQILMTKFRTLEATILGLVNTNKTYDELLAEVETLEIQIRKEAMRDGGLPNFLIQKTYDDIDKVKTFLKEMYKTEPKKEQKEEADQLGDIEIASNKWSLTTNLVPSGQTWYITTIYTTKRNKQKRIAYTNVFQVPLS